MAKEKDEKVQQPESITEIVVATPEVAEPAPPAEVAAVEPAPEEPSPAQIEGTAPAAIDSLRAMISEKFGKQFDTDEEMYAWIHEQLLQVSDTDGVVGEILKEYPELYAVIQDLQEGKPLEVALAANIDTDSLQPLEGEEMYAEYEAARNARKERKAKADEHRATFEKNMEDSNKIIHDFFTEVAFTPEQGEEFVNKMDDMLRDYVNGIVTREFLDVFYRAMNYEQAMESAREAGAIDAKNARIDAERERAEAETDGLPRGGSAVGVTMPEAVEEDDLFGEVRRKSRKNW